MNIYLASPYTCPDEEVRAVRFDATCEAAAAAMVLGHSVFSPIAHSHNVCAWLPERLILDHEFWMRQDLPMLERWADELWILTIFGWQRSRGIKREIEAAEARGIPIRAFEKQDDCTFKVLDFIL